MFKISWNIPDIFQITHSNIPFKLISHKHVKNITSIIENILADYKLVAVVQFGESLCLNIIACLSSNSLGSVAMLFMDILVEVGRPNAPRIMSRRVCLNVAFTAQ